MAISRKRLEGVAFSEQEIVLAELDEQRNALHDRLKHDFAKDPLNDETFHRWGTVINQQPELDGLHVIAPGSDDWTSVGLAPQLELEGDFDISVALDVLSFGIPAKQRKSAFYLVVEFPDEIRTKASLIFLESVERGRRLYAQVQHLDDNGNKVYYKIGAVSVETVEGLRIARRGKRFSFIFREKGSQREALLGHANINTMAIPKTYIRLMLHTSGAGRQSEVLLKQAQFFAEKIDPSPPE